MVYQRPRPITAVVSTKERGAANRKDKKTLVTRGQSHATMVYSGETPVGWCQYGPREELPRIDAGLNYRKIGPVSDGEKLWRITCFFVDKGHRGQGVPRIALRAALESIKKQGGGIVEAYPVISKKMAAMPERRRFGTSSMFLRERFEPVAPLGTNYLLMRKTILPR